MQAEQIEIAGFLKQYPPFNALPEPVIDEIACQVEISYFRADSDVFQFGDEIHDLCVIRSGAVEIYRRNGDLYNRLSEGELFGQLSLLMSQRVRLPARTIEDSLIYFIPETLFSSLCERFDSFAYFVEMDDNRLRQAVSSKQESSDLMVSKVTALISRTPVWLDTSTTIRQAAQKMTEEGVSSLLIMQPQRGDDGSAEYTLAGIITDRDLRTRVVATGLDLESPVTQVMTQDPVTLDDDAYAFEAMLTMLRYNLHHLPVLHDDQPVGVLATSDIVRYESQSSLYMVSNIMRQPSVEELARLQPQISACFVRMVSEDANSHMIGSAMSVIGRTFKQRLLELAEEKLGPPPLPYCFLALGSMARDEQLVVTDQDNALILDNSYRPELHGEYFKQLATFVSDGLNRCGYTYCTGKIMATNPEWRKTRQQWEATFADWMDNPLPEALLNCSIFFDLDGVWGKTEWASQLNTFISLRAQRSPKFLASLARNALNRTPPLGFFKNFVMEQDGQHRNSINLKRRGTAPLADLVRVHALAVGSRVQNSFERLDDVVDADILPPGKAADLRDALEFISMVRIRHQAADIEAGREPSNNVKPEKLTDFDRRNLKEAFQVLSNSQRFLKFRYPFSGR
ncbi:putative nucleotidyltransferase substrate binding domain-containing protein [Amphritea pacifica]|uniref:Cyclic nucleotide-binding/CBS domain-containing protein n=1 Tax=Amphritea pacifica TaxID=2811233 RepID=A0ABS2W926_9GAMM|nr:putative nucleotidyltransferase substrate binding domain-containing protein [Amphritea pacifica]MBN0988218.1 cyclic nucleotide-binding/CBS domain-containing protein [Amphritea pacifica]MBN1008437.1 cyclic nucleotide-binding/CBS domain-containing protein [Amphritea pacifica]